MPRMEKEMTCFFFDSSSTSGFFFDFLWIWIWIWISFSLMFLILVCSQLSCSLWANKKDWHLGIKSKRIRLSYV